MVELIPGTRVYLPVQAVVCAEVAVKKTWEEGFRMLLRAMFPQDVLATHCCLGKRSSKPPLDSVKLTTLQGIII